VLVWPDPVVIGRLCVWRELWCSRLSLRSYLDETLIQFGLSYIVLEILLSFYQFLILCSPLFIVYFVFVECFTYNIKFYFELYEFEILKHRKTRYPNIPSLTDVTSSFEVVRIFCRSRWESSWSHGAALRRWGRVSLWVTWTRVAW